MSYFRLLLLFYSVLFLFSSLGTCLGLGDLTLEQKVGQVLMIGISGKEISPETLSQIEGLSPGGIILFKKNIGDQKQLLRLTRSLQAKSKTALLIAVDQEGGPVTRLKTAPMLPSAKWVGDRRSPELTEALGYALGGVLRRLGINMNLAPVLDVGDASSGGFLRARSYSNDAEVVGDLGLAFSQGMIRSGVIPTAKHFPGLGSVVGDPHNEIVRQDSSYKEMQAKHLSPFRKFAQLTPAAVMLSHAKYPTLGSSDPASLSQKISQNLLRSDLAFRGLIITDDLMMTGASEKKLSFQEKVVKVFKSGSDILLIAWSTRSQRAAHKALLDAIKNKLISISELNIKVERILFAKNWLAEKRKVRSLASNPESELKKTIEALNLVGSKATGQ